MSNRAALMQAAQAISDALNTFAQLPKTAEPTNVLLKDAGGRNLAMIDRNSITIYAGHVREWDGAVAFDPIEDAFWSGDHEKFVDEVRNTPTEGGSSDR